MKTFAAAIGAALLAFGAAPALAQDDSNAMAEKVVNAPLPGSLQVNGLRQKPTVVRDKTVEGGKALRVSVPGASDQPWTVSLQTATTKPLKKGDTIVLAFWAKAKTLPEGKASARIANAQLQGNAAPYPTVFGQGIDVTPEWYFHQVRGKADKDYAPGTVAATLHLATARQVIDFGPFFILDLGQ